MTGICDHVQRCLTDEATVSYMTNGAIPEIAPAAVAVHIMLFS